MAFDFRLQFVLEKAYASEADARGLVVEARICYDALTVRRGEVASAIAEHRVFRIALLRARDPSFAASEASILALEAVGAKVARDVARASAMLARARSAFAESSRHRVALERLRDRRRTEYELRRSLRESAELDEANAIAASRDSFANDLGDRERAGDEAPPSDASKTCGVITLHRANGRPLIVNADLIETVERTDDGETAIVLTTGNVLVVTEPPESVRAAAVAFRRSIVAPGP